MLIRPPACRSIVLPTPAVVRLTPPAVPTFAAESTDKLPVPDWTLAFRSILPEAVLISTLPAPPALIRLLTVSAPPLLTVMAPLVPLTIPAMVPLSLTVLSAPVLETRFTLLGPILPTVRVLLSLRKTPAFRALTLAATVTAEMSRLAEPVPTLLTATSRTLPPLMLTIRLAVSSF